MDAKRFVTNFLIIIFIFFICITYLSYGICESFQNDEIQIPDIKKETSGKVIPLLDENDKPINVMAIRFYMDNEKERNAFIKYHKEGYKFIGCSSMLSFPRYCENNSATYCREENKENQKIDGKDVEDYVMGWCHCFRQPNMYIKNNIPQILISESDFNSERLKSESNIENKYDFVCHHPTDKDCGKGWHGHNKNYELFKKSIKILCDEMNLRGFIAGWDMNDCPLDISNTKNIETSGFLSNADFHKKIMESKFLLVPNYEDASPRVLTEALCLNVPVLVNEKILGGWKYVNDDTGVFFNEYNLEVQTKLLMKRIREGKLSPRENYLKYYGLKNSGKQLRDWLVKLYPELSPCKYVKFPIT